MWRREEHGALASQLLDDAPHLDDLRRVEPDGRLVQDQDLRLVEQRLRQPEALAQSLGQVADEAVGTIDQVDLLEHLVDAVVQVRARAAANP